MALGSRAPSSTSFTSLIPIFLFTRRADGVAFSAIGRWRSLRRRFRKDERKKVPTDRPTDRPTCLSASLSLSLSASSAFPYVCFSLLGTPLCQLRLSLPLSRAHFVFLPMSFAVHLETQFSRASGPFRVALPTFHLRRGALSRAGDDSRVLLHAVPICCVT